MAIDSSMCMADIKAGEYVAGQRIPIKFHTGSQVVRDGYGPAILKKIRSGSLRAQSGSVVPGYFEIKNSNWVDPVINHSSTFFGATALSNETQGVQLGNDVELQPNSSWDIEYVVTSAVTTTIDNTFVVILDIDYPQVAAVTNPAGQKGTPASTKTDIGNIVAATIGSCENTKWAVQNVDILKAGYRYLLQKIGVYTANDSASSGFIAISGAAPMGGLVQIFPFNSDNTGYLKPAIDYAVPLVKGPMNISVIAFTSAGDMYTVMDWVKR